MNITGINKEKCTGCQECLKECPPKLFSLKDKKAEFSNPYKNCIACGHCVAVCPEDAVLYEEAEKPFSFANIENPEKIASYETIFQVLTAQRSIRRFKKKALSDEDLNSIFNAMAHAPSASNARKWEYIVIRDEEKRRYFGEKVIQMFYQLLKLIKLRKLIGFFLPKGFRKVLGNKGLKIGIERTINEFKEGGDPVFFHAPCIIVLHSPTYGSMAGNDAGIALTYGSLAAQALGIGSCWIGFAKEAALRDSKLRQWLTVPKGRKVEGVLALGYPGVKFHRVPEREKPNVRFL